MAEEAAAAGMTAAAVDLTAEVIGMVAIAKETTEAMVLAVETVTAGVADLTAEVTAGARANLLIVVK